MTDESKKIRPLWLKITLISITVFSIIFIASMLFNARQMISTQLDDIFSTHLLFVNSLSVDIEEEIKNSETTVSFLSSESLLESVFIEKDYSVLEKYRSEMIGKCDSFYLTDFNSGETFELGREAHFVGSNIELLHGVSVSDYENAIVYAQKGRSSLSVSYFDDITMEPVFLISYPINKNNEQLGMISMRFNLTSLWAKIDEISSGVDVSASIVNINNKIVAHSDRNVIGKEFDAPFSHRLFLGLSGVGEYEIDGSYYIGSYGSVVGRSPLAVVILQDSESAFGAIYYSIFTSSILAVLGMLLIVISSVILGKMFTKPVRPIVEAIKQASSTLDIPEVIVNTNDEFSLIADNFNQTIQELKEKESIKQMFGQYISSDIRDEILKGSLRLDGEEKECSILFSDIRGFTTLSERFPPKTMLSILNEYFAEMIKVIELHNGSVNKFMGDALMVLYGIPLNKGNHGIQAVESAIGMFKALQELNRSFNQSYGLELAIGIGIATGKVIAGNIGVVQRREYSVIGDIVNIASRLEKVTKLIEYPIVFTNETAVLLKGRVKTKCLGKYRVRGREKPLVLYSLDESVYKANGISLNQLAVKA